MDTSVVSHTAPPTHVLVVNTPDPNVTESIRVAWYTFDATIVAIVIAVAAAALAGWALVVAILDARNNAKQLMLLLREPDIGISFEGGTNEYASTSVETPLRLPLQITNSGNKNVLQYKVEFLLPWNSLSPDTTQRPLSSLGHYTYENEEYSRWSKVVDVPLTQHSRTRLPILTVNIPPMAQAWKIHWRVTTEEHIFPKDGSFGTLVIKTT